jgi:hypothetical protein
VIADPTRRGRSLAEFYGAVAPRLFRDLEESGALPSGADAVAVARARTEWESFALYACVRALVAAGGFNRETGAAIEALHEAALGSLIAGAPGAVEAAGRRARIAERYAEYGAIGQEGGAAGAESVTRRLGEAAARHMAAPGTPGVPLIEIAGSLHEQLVEGATEAVRAAE